MKLKYFLRGLGAGIIFSAVIMLAAYMTSGGYKLSDREIISRAEKLGMVMGDNPTDASASDAGSRSTEEKTTEADSQKDFTTTGEPEPANPEEPKDLTEGTENPDAAGFTTEEEPEPATEKPMLGEPTSNEEPADTEEKQDDYTTVQITIRSGMGSEEVAELLKDAGIIRDAADFDSYLNDNGYSTRIETGTFRINSNMTYLEIAELLCGKTN